MSAFEFDERKSASSKAKHGIDFVEAQAIFEDDRRLEIPARMDDEPRFMVIGSSRCAAPARRRSGGMKAKEFDKKLDRGEDVSASLDLAKARRPGEEQRRVNVDFPSWMIDLLDREAKRLGVTRQSIIKIWIAERLENRVA